VALTLLLFANATALTGIFHQVGWLFGKHTTLVYDSSRATDNAAGQTARGIYLGVLNYAGDHDGRFPESLDQLVPDYLDNSKPFEYRVLGLDGGESGRRRFVYVPGLPNTSDASAIVIYTPVPAYRNHMAVYADGSVRTVTAEKLEADLWRTERIILAGKAKDQRP
jgi:hypothetical protein